MPPSCKEKGYKFPVLPLSPVTPWVKAGGVFPGCMRNVVIIACNVAPSRSLFNCRAFVIKLKRIIVYHISETRNGKKGGTAKSPTPTIPFRVRVLFPHCISVFLWGAAATPIYEQVEFLSSVCCLRGDCRLALRWFLSWLLSNFWWGCVLGSEMCISHRTMTNPSHNSLGFIG